MEKYPSDSHSSASFTQEKKSHKENEAHTGAQKRPRKLVRPHSATKNTGFKKTFSKSHAPKNSDSMHSAQSTERSYAQKRDDSPYNKSQRDNNWQKKNYSGRDGNTSWSEKPQRNGDYKKRSDSGDSRSNRENGGGFNRDRHSSGNAHGDKKPFRNERNDRYDRNDRNDRYARRDGNDRNDRYNRNDRKDFGDRPFKERKNFQERDFSDKRKPYDNSERPRRGGESFRQDRSGSFHDDKRKNFRPDFNDRKRDGNFGSERKQREYGDSGERGSRYDRERPSFSAHGNDRKSHSNYDDKPRKRYSDEGRRDDFRRGNDSFAKNSFHKRDDRGERKDFRERRDFRERKEYGERKDFRERKEYGERKDFRERKEYGERRDFRDSRDFSANSRDDNQHFHTQSAHSSEQFATPPETSYDLERNHVHSENAQGTVSGAGQNPNFDGMEQHGNVPLTPSNFGENTGERRPFRFEDRDNRSKRGDKRPPLRETVMNMDRDMLKMLARRSNILEKMSVKTGHLEVREEKEIRASWERAATQMTRDPRIIHQLFNLFQEVTFSAKPEAGKAKRSGFNLAPPQLPVNIRMQAPINSRRSRLFLALAAASGSACRMQPSLLDDATVECIKMFNQCATSLAWDDDGTLISRQGGGLSLPDKVIYVGDDLLNFCLLLGHYVGHNTKAKFTGEARLKSTDLTALRSFLPMLGARLSNVMPGTSGFPVRLECSGIFSSTVDIPKNLPADCILGLLLAAPFWENPMQFNLQAHPDKEAIMEEALFALEPCQDPDFPCVRRENDKLIFTPKKITTPKEPELGMDLQFAAYILALPACLGGTVALQGHWPKCSQAQELEAFFKSVNLSVSIDSEGISTHHEIPESVQQKMQAAAQKAAEQNNVAFSDIEQNDTEEAVIEQISFEHGNEDAVTEQNSFEQNGTEDAVIEQNSLEQNEEGFESENAFGQVSFEENIDENDLVNILETLEFSEFGLMDDARFMPLYAALSYIFALRHKGKKRIVLPDTAPLEEMEAFFNYLGFEYEENALVAVQYMYDNDAVFTADTPAFALAFALAAAVKPHIKLNNPGIMTDLYPQFWNLYNALPSFDIKKNVSEQKHDKPVRRRIIAADQEGIGSGDSTN